MNKCESCGTEFEGKFCPECGKKASVDKEDTAVAAESRDVILEDQIMREGLYKAYELHNPEQRLKDKRISICYKLVGTLMILPVAVVLVIGIMKIIDWNSMNLTEMILAYDKYISDLKTLIIILTIAMHIMIVLKIVRDIMSRSASRKIIKWISEQNIAVDKLAVNMYERFNQSDHYDATMWGLYWSDKDNSKSASRILKKFLICDIINAVSGIAIFIAIACLLHWFFIDRAIQDILMEQAILNRVPYTKSTELNAVAWVGIGFFIFSVATFIIAHIIEKIVIKKKNQKVAQWVQGIKNGARNSERRQSD